MATNLIAMCLVPGDPFLELLRQEIACRCLWCAMGTAQDADGHVQKHRLSLILYTSQCASHISVRTTMCRDTDGHKTHPRRLCQTGGGRLGCNDAQSEKRWQEGAAPGSHGVEPRHM